jgi:hypothetical protein
MKKNSQLTRVVLYQNLGFLSVLVICLLDEIFKLPSLLFANLAVPFIHREFAIEMLLVSVVWFLVSASTRRILERVRYLEKFMRVCSWCRQIHYNGQWMPLEEFMRHGFDTPTTHGICKECLRRQQAIAEKAKAARKNMAAAVTPSATSPIATIAPAAEPVELKK